MATSALDLLPREVTAEHRDYPDAPRDVPAFVIDALGGDIAAVRRLHPGSRERDAARHRLLIDHELIILDRISAQTDLVRGETTARIPCLDINAIVLNSVLEAVTELMDGGAWATIRVAYEGPDSSRSLSGVARIVEARLVRTVIPDLSKLLKQAGQLSRSQWQEVLFEAIGRNPASLPARARQLIEVRLASLAENNLNLMELGGAGTAKSFTASLSPHAITLSGRISNAGLFHNLNTRQPGVLVRHDLVTLDDVTKMNIEGGEATVAALKGYMEDGKVTRTGIVHNATSSLVLQGNVEMLDGRPRDDRIIESLPPALRDGPLWDRIHGLIPGEVPVVTPDSLYYGPALASDVLAEILHGLRAEDWTVRIRESLEWDPSMSVRDLRAVVKVTSGLLKVRFPAGNWSEDDLVEAATLACELRQRVYNQMAILSPGEFRPRTIGFTGIAPFATGELQRPPGRGASVSGAAVGRVTGLGANVEAKTGGTFAIQATPLPIGSSGARISGTRGPMIEQSVEAAYAYVRSNAEALGIPPAAIEGLSVDVHWVKRWGNGDGPSAGAAIATAIVSQLTGRPIRGDIAVTGTIDPNGKVGSVGGVALKIEAAWRAGCLIVCVPKANAGALNEVDDAVIAGIEVRLVDSMDEVLDAALTTLLVVPSAA